MIRLKITLKPRTTAPINLNYKNKLHRLCNEAIRYNISKFQTITKSKINKNELFFSPLFCCKYEVSGDKITFKDDVNWYITTSSYDLILQIVQGLYQKNIIKIGKTEMEVVGLELTEVSEPKLKNKSMWKTKYIYNYNTDTPLENTSIM